MGPDAPPYTEFQLGGESIAGGQEMQPMVPAQVPSYWLVYFAVNDVDKSFKTATQAGARETVAPMDFPGGRFAILSAARGAAWGLHRMPRREKSLSGAARRGGGPARALGAPRTPGSRYELDD